jgi:hypothetical protein
MNPGRNRNWHIDYRPANPRNSGSCIVPLTYLGRAYSAYINEAHSAIRSVGIPADISTGWNCQGYVLEAANALVSAALIDQDDVLNAERELAPYSEDMADYDPEEQQQEDDGRILSAEVIEDSGSE